jgi:predicted phosphodiesterase
MKMAIISDIHANFEAFGNVLADADEQRIATMVCLGDCIGYGPEPEAVITEVRRREIPSLIGNHEMAVCDRLHLNWFNPLARSSLEKTLTMLSADSMAYIKTLPYSRVLSNARFVHGYPPESARTYLFRKAPYELRNTFESMAEPICFVGHTHNLELVQYDGRQVERSALPQGITRLETKHRYIINIGSVGQPRDGTNHAKYVIWDTDLGQIEVRFIRYDIAATVNKIKSAGLPENHASRLW